MPPRRVRRLAVLAAAAAIALPALGQDRPASILPPGFNDAPPPPALPPAAPNRPVTAPAAREAPASPPAAAVSVSPEATANSAEGTADVAGPTDSLLAVSDSLSSDEQALAAATAATPIEMPKDRRRDPSQAGLYAPEAIGLPANPWGGASGSFLEQAMRRTEGQLPSRWLHIALRRTLLARTPTPVGVAPADWVAERAWLLLRMGEADAARMLIDGVDVADFTPKLRQVAVQSALANADPAALCPLRVGLSAVEPRIAELVDAMCMSLSGNPEAAAADIDSARRRGRLGGIDAALAGKLVGAGADTARAVTIDWQPVPRVNAWRFGLAAATGLAVPDRLLDEESPALRAWYARAPMLSIEQRLPSARVAAGLGVLSGQALVDAYAGQYDRLDPDELAQSDALQLRLAFLGQDRDARLAAMRKLWTTTANDPVQHEAARAMLAVAASLIQPDAALAADAPELIASMLAGGLDKQAARWAGVLGAMGDADADRCWAMLALAAPELGGLDVSYDRIDKFIGRDSTPGHRRGALLVAGLIGLKRIDPRTAGRLSGRYGFGLDRDTQWSDLMIGAARRGQVGTTTVLAALGFKSTRWSGIPALHLFYTVSALNHGGQDQAARMVAAEALSRS